MSLSSGRRKVPPSWSWYTNSHRLSFAGYKPVMVSANGFSTFWSMKEFRGVYIAENPAQENGVVFSNVQ